MQPVWDAVWNVPHPIAPPAPLVFAQSAGGAPPLAGRYPLETMDGLEIHSTDVGGPRIADTPPLALHQPYNRVLGQLTAGHQGALPFGELPVACRAAQPFDMLACPGPGPMRNIAFPRLVEPRTSWIWT